MFIFQAGSTLITGSNSSVVLSGGVQASNVFWQVGSSATLGTGTAFVGTILALTSITVTTGASVDGRALARNGAVTLDGNVFGNAPTPAPGAGRRSGNGGCRLGAGRQRGHQHRAERPQRDLDTYPTPAVTGFPPGVTMGAQHAADAVALAAQHDLTTAYNAAAAAPSTSNVTGVDLGGQTLTPGVYTAAAGMALTGPVPLTLSGTRRLGVHLPGGQHPHHRLEQLGGPLRGCPGQQRVLAGGLVGDPRDRDRFRGHHPGLDVDHRYHRCVGRRQGLGPQRGRDLGRQRLRQLADSRPPARAPAVFPEPAKRSSLWAAGIDGSGVNVAVIDTGIDNLPDFAGRLVGGVDLSGEVNPFSTTMAMAPLSPA